MALVDRTLHRPQPKKLQQQSQSGNINQLPAQKLSDCTVLTETAVYEVIESMSVTREGKLAVVGGTLLQTLYSYCAEVACIRRVVSEDSGTSRHEGVYERHCASGMTRRQCCDRTTAIDVA